MLILNRAAFLASPAWVSLLATSFVRQQPFSIPATPQPPLQRSDGTVIHVPLEPCSGGCYCVGVEVQSSSPVGVAGVRRLRRTYRAAVDTGSPYLVLGGDKDIVGERGVDGVSEALRKLALLPSFDLPDYEAGGPTDEVYGTVDGIVSWKRAELVSLGVDAKGGSRTTTPNVVLGTLDYNLDKEAGGTLLGLVKHPNPPRQQENYRPTLLQQMRLGRGEPVTSFSIDPASALMTLSSRSLLPASHVPRIPLLDMRPLGEFVEHYNCPVDQLVLDGRQVGKGKLLKRKIVAVLDSGLTGCLLTPNLWEALLDEGLDPRRAKRFVVQVQSTSPEGRAVELTSGRSVNRQFYVAPLEVDWFYDPASAPYLIVLGQTFLAQGRLSIDVEKRLATFEQQKPLK